MSFRNVQTANEMVDYLTDCTLATVDDYCMKKTRPKGEFNRQCGIAQKGINFLLSSRFNKFTNRCAEVINDFDGSVDDYAANMIEKLSRYRS